MARILAFTAGPQDWQALLADPEKHWRAGFSARTLAHCWEAADGFPPEVAALFAGARDAEIAGTTPLLAIPEFKVPLPGGERSSQNDIFVLGRCGPKPVAIMVEGKVDESFGPTLGIWLAEASPGKRDRLRYLLKMIGLAAEPPAAIRYQLLHRAASAAIVGEQFRAGAAMLVVHTFTGKNAGWTDYQAFLRLFGVEAKIGTAQRLPGTAPVPLFAAWVTGDTRFLQS